MQEFFAYGEIFIHSPNICQAMQQKIINILLHDVYVTKEYFLQRAKIFILKGKTFRVRSSGLDGLNNCIQCLSEAIILLVSCLITFRILSFLKKSHNITKFSLLKFWYRIAHLGILHRRKYHIIC